MLHSILRAIVVRKWLFQRIFPYLFLIAILLAEMYAAYYHVRPQMVDRFSLIGLVVFFFSLRLAGIRLKGAVRVAVFILTWILCLILTVHSGYLFGNGTGFTISNCIHIMQPDMVLEFIKMSPGFASLLILLFLLLPPMIFGAAFLLYWSLRPLPRKRWVRYAGLVLAAVSAAVVFGFFQPAREVKALLTAYDHVRLDKTILHSSGVNFSPVTYETLQAAPGKNLIFIILESTELIFLDESLFPGLLPNLKKISGESQLFQNIETSYGADATFPAMFNMMRGYYITPKILFNRSQGERLCSFPEILKKAGYRQYFLAGCSGNFAQTETFVKAQCYNVVWFGIERTKREISWKFSLRDSAVYEQAWKFFQQAVAEKKPFNITLLTIDAHAPDGFYDPAEPAYPHPEKKKDYPPLFDAMYASDHALGRFLDRVRSSPAAGNTCIVITSDHPAYQYANTGSRLSWTRDKKMLFMIWNSAVSKFRPDVRGQTFDEAPTILDALGVRHNYTFPLGQSLLSDRLNPQRLKYTQEQEAVLSSYLSLKSLHPVRLPEKICVAARPYPMVRIGAFNITLSSMRTGTDLPHGEECFMLGIPKNRTVGKLGIRHFLRLADFSVARADTPDYIFIAENNEMTSRYFHVPRKKGYILGLRLHRKTIIKTASRPDGLVISKEEVRSLL